MPAHAGHFMRGEAGQAMAILRCDFRLSCGATARCAGDDVARSQMWASAFVPLGLMEVAQSLQSVFRRTRADERRNFHPRAATCRQLPANQDPASRLRLRLPLRLLSKTPDRPLHPNFPMPDPRASPISRTPDLDTSPMSGE